MKCDGCTSSVSEALAAVEAGVDDAQVAPLGLDAEGDARAAVVVEHVACVAIARQLDAPAEGAHELAWDGNYAQSFGVVRVTYLVQARDLVGDQFGSGGLQWRSCIDLVAILQVVGREFRVNLEKGLFVCGRLVEALRGKRG